MRRQRLPRLLLAGLAVAATACSSPDDASDATPPEDVAIEVVDFAYASGTIEVAAGSTVEWTNRDRFAHTVTSGTPSAPDGRFDEPLGDPTTHEGADTTASVTFEDPGTYPYFCDLHPSMVGEVVVTAP